MPRAVETVWEPSAEWIVEFLVKPQMEILRVAELQAANEAMATMFAFRFVASEGYSIEKEHLTLIKIERIN